MIKRLLLSLVALVAFGLQAAEAQLPPINGVAGPTTSTQFRSIITDPSGSGSVLFDSGLAVNSLAALKALTTRPASVATLGYYSAGDGGGGPPWGWFAADATAADDCSVVTPTSGTAGRWKRDLSVASDPRWCGAYGTAVPLTPSAVSITTGTAALTVAGGIFNAGDVGKKIRVPGAGVAGALLSTTISGFTSGTQITLAANASTTLAAASKPVVYGYDDTTAIQTALTLSKSVVLSCGNYFVTATLTMGSNRSFLGEGTDCALIVRTDAYSHTLQGTPGVAAGSVTLRNMFFLEPQYFATGITTLPFAAAAGAAHVFLEGAQGAVVDGLRLYNMPYGILLKGATTSVISNNNALGVWDPNTAALQEAIASLKIEASSLPANTQILKLRDNTFGGTNTTGGSVNISTTCGTIPVTIANRAIGPKYGIWATDGEDVLAEGNYFGAQSDQSLFLDLSGVLLGWRVENSFFDAPAHTGYSIYVTTGISPNAVNSLSITNNVMNGQLRGRGAIYINNPTGAVSAYSVLVSNNIMLASLGAPMQLHGVKGAIVSNNKVKSYDENNICTTDPQIAAGLYLGAQATQVSANGNQWGGGNFGETTSPPNYTAWGIYAAAGASYSAAAETGIGLLTALFGGAAPTFSASTPLQSQALMGAVGPPAPTSCGTSPSVSANSSNNAGQFTTGTGTPAACTLTFAFVNPTSAFCTVVPVNAAAIGTTVRVSASSASAFTVTLGAGTDGAAFNYTCIGN